MTKIFKYYYKSSPGARDDDRCVDVTWCIQGAIKGLLTQNKAVLRLASARIHPYMIHGGNTSKEISVEEVKTWLESQEVEKYMDIMYADTTQIYDGELNEATGDEVDFIKAGLLKRMELAQRQLNTITELKEFVFS